MTLMKSVLLGSAATLVVVAGAQAADLPTKKGAPAVQYVKVCNIAGVAGFVLPGSDTCFKISGGIEAMAAFGTYDTQLQMTPVGPESATLTSKGAYNLPGPGGFSGDTKYRDHMGFDARGDLQVEAVSNTANGPLIGVIDIHIDQGYGIGIAGYGAGYAGGFTTNSFSDTYVNLAYVQWAGITAGIHTSFYDYIAGGETWWNIISPEHSGTGIPLFAYTATFGGGFSATISAEQQENTNQFVYSVPAAGYVQNTELSSDAPDIVGSLDVTQSWGTAHLAAVAHNVHVESPTGLDLNDWGWGVIGGVGFNLPQLGAGDVVKFQGAYSYGAVGYSGMTTSGWGQGDNGLNINGNGLIYNFTDAADVRGTWVRPETWSVAATGEFNLTPQFAFDPEVSYGAITWQNVPVGATWEGNAWSWVVGAVFSWKPVTNLSFNFEPVYQYSHFDRGGGLYSLANVPTDASGFNGRIRIERDF
jgi:hypothetical protein